MQKIISDFVQIMQKQTRQQAAPSLEKMAGNMLGKGVGRILTQVGIILMLMLKQKSELAC